MSTILTANNLTKHYFQTRGFFSRVEKTINALDNISIEIEAGKTMAIVGESGSGKSTLAKALIRLISIDSGDIFFKDKKISDLSIKQLKVFRKDIQMIFQDPYASLNPRFKVKDILEEPLLINKIGNKLERNKKINSLIKKVGLNEEDLEKYPHQFSGGQRQRIGIARALILKPKIVICDEPVSALDVSIQAQILNLLKKLQKEYSLTLLFITHDLRVVRQIADSIYVMRSGRLIEEGKTDIIFKNPKNDYTKSLINSIPGRIKR
jgi:oligopeptide transport system ATP-binding protein